MTFASIFAAVRDRLSDTDAADLKYTDAYLKSFGRQAYEAMVKAFNLHGLRAVKHRTPYILPVNTSVIVPRSLGIANFAAPLRLWDRAVKVKSALLSSPVPSFESGTGFLLVRPSDLTGFASGQTVEIVGEKRVGYAVNDSWTITVVGGDIRLNGCTADLVGSTITGGNAPGTVVLGSGKFLPVDSTTMHPNELPTVLVPAVTWHMWDRTYIRVSPVSVERELMIEYTIAGTVDLTDLNLDIVYEDVESFLVPYMAGLVASTNSMPALAEALLVEACGRDPMSGNSEPNGYAGALGSLIAARVKSLQQNIYQSSYPAGSSRMPRHEDGRSFSRYA